MGDLEF